MNKIKLKKLVDSFYKGHDNILKIIAINLKNKDNIKKWHLFSKNVNKSFQSSIKISNKNFNSIKLNIGDSVFLINGKKEFVSKSSSFDFKKNILIAEVQQSKYFGKIWKIFKENSFIELDDECCSLFFNNHLFNSNEYREEVFIIENKITGFKYLTNIRGQIVMKSK